MGALWRVTLWRVTRLPPAGPNILRLGANAVRHGGCAYMCGLFVGLPCQGHGDVVGDLRSLKYPDP